MKIIKPKNIRIINDDGYFRLRYNIGKVTITTAGFNTRKELAKLIENDGDFKLEIGEKE